jgi:hypothetical protein
MDLKSVFFNDNGAIRNSRICNKDWLERNNLLDALQCLVNETSFLCESATIRERLVAFRMG